MPENQNGNAVRLTDVGGLEVIVVSVLRHVLSRRGAKVLLVICVGLALPYRSTPQAPSTSQSGVSGVQTLRGRTINAITGAPIARVLVHCGADAMLTDSEGAFQFAVDGESASLTASKPGYWPQEDPAESSTTVFRAPYPETSVELRLYPEALLTGTVTSSAGEPLAGILITPRRSVFDESGHHWEQVGITRTNSHGEFRIPLVPGSYSLQTMYTPPGRMRKEAVLNVTVPEDSSTRRSDAIVLHSGETQHLDLRPPLLPVVPVVVRMEPESKRTDARVALESSAGTIYPNQVGTSDPSETQLDVPAGTYLLTAQRHTAEGLEHAETRITVGDRPVSGLILRFSLVNPISVEIQVEPGVTSDNTAPTFAQLGVMLQSTKAGVDPGDAQQFTRRGGNLPGVLTPPPGSYRLSAQAGGTWFIRSATYGTSDLLTHDLVVAPGIGSAPIRLVVSNQTASIAGTVRLNGQSAVAWIYLVSSTPSATPLLIVHADANGTYNRSGIPPGSYRAIAFEHKHALDLQDADTQALFANDLHAVTLNSGNKATLDLEVAPYREGR